MKRSLIKLIGISCLIFLSTECLSQDKSKYRIVAHQNNQTDVVSISNTVELTDPIRIQIPNAFTPDGDQINDFFKIKGIGVDDYNLVIFDRWGKQIFESNSIEHSWDGMYRGKPAQQGVYTFQLTASNTEFGIHRTFTNTLTLIR